MHPEKTWLKMFSALEGLKLKHCMYRLGPTITYFEYLVGLTNSDLT